MEWQKYIISDPEIMFGKPVIKGTRIPVDLVLEKMAYGQTIGMLLKSYSKLTEESIKACLFFAANNAKHEKTLAVA